MQDCEATESGPRPVFEFRHLSDSGLIWLINRVVFHPRGCALALDYREGEDQPRGWTLMGSNEPWRFVSLEENPTSGVDEDAKFAAVEKLIADARRYGMVPVQSHAEAVQTFEGARAEAQRLGACLFVHGGHHYMTDDASHDAGEPE